MTITDAIPPPQVALAARLEAVRARIRASAEANGRDPDSVQLLAVSKTHSAVVVAQALGLGQFRFGENYVQEAVAKMDALRAMAIQAPIEWHFIGPIQSNKTRLIAERFDWVQSLDREQIAVRLSNQRPETRAPLNVLIEVNLAAEASKSGVDAQGVLPLARAILDLPRLVLRGVMAIPRPTSDAAQQRDQFDQLHAIGAAVKAVAPSADTLSMGMSGDFEAAIGCGSTLVRIGTAIFGERA